jgi:2-dehydropantoate 2-reductase
MSEQTVFSIVGTGAVGGFYGSLLQRAGFEVHFLLHGDYEHVKKCGLIIDSCNGSFCLPSVHAHRSPEEMPPGDVIIVALKTTANRALPEILPHLVKDGTVILTLQNGLGSEGEIAAIAGDQNVLGGLCFLCANKTDPGHIRHLDYGLVTLGEYRPDGQPGGITPQLDRIGGMMQNAGISIQFVDDLALARWKKLVWNIPFNGMSVIENAMTDQLVKAPAMRARCEVLMHEVATASACCARPIEEAFLDKMMNDTLKMKPYATSMKLDFDHGKPMEVESIYGNPLRAAAAAGIDMPETEKLYRQLKQINPVV